MFKTDAEAIAFIADACAQMAVDMVAARGDVAKMFKVTARCLATTEHCLAELRAMNAEAGRLG
jgi:uncharacterized protein YerC